MTTDNYQLNQIVTINSLKFDRSIARTWTAKLIKFTDSMIEMVGEFTERVEHPKLGIIEPGTISYEYYWFDRWYNIFRFHNPDSSFRNYYCNVNMPPTLRDGVLDYVDLDIDILVWGDYRFEVLDLDEFAENALKFGYPSGVRENAQDALNKLVSLIETGEFPFNQWPGETFGTKAAVSRDSD